MARAAVPENITCALTKSIIYFRHIHFHTHTNTYTYTFKCKYINLQFAQIIIIIFLLLFQFTILKNMHDLFRTIVTMLEF